MLASPLPRHFWAALGLTLGSLLVTAWVMIAATPAAPGGQATATATLAPAATTARPLPVLAESPIASAAPTSEPTPLPLPSPTAAAGAAELTPDGVTRTVGVPILMYHYVGGLPADADIYRVDLTVSPEQFEAQLAYLQRAGYTGIALEELVRHLATGSPLPPQPIVLTFDDGYVDNYLYAFPLLRQYGFRGTFFVVTGFLDEGRGGYLTWEQARLMHDHGMDIQPHGLAHDDLRSRPEEDLLAELIACRRAVEERLGKSARLFAYASGRYDERVLAAMPGAGYVGAVTTAPGVEHSSDGLLELSRIRIHGADDLEDFAAVLAHYQ